MAEGGGPRLDQLPRSLFVDFLDPLFAVAIGIGFDHGLLLEPWLISWSLPRGQNLFDLFVFILGLFFIAMSWFGYHKSVKNKPLKGNLRFVLDVALVLFYLLLLFKYKDFSATLLVLVIIYLLYILWDILKVIEHPEDYDKNVRFFSRYARELITAQWFVLFALLFLINYLFNIPVPSLILAYLGTIFYRTDKKKHFAGHIWNGIKNWSVGS